VFLIHCCWLIGVVQVMLLSMSVEGVISLAIVESILCIILIESECLLMVFTPEALLLYTIVDSDCIICGCYLR